MPLNIGKTIRTQETDSLPSDVKDAISKTTNQSAGIEGAGFNNDVLTEPIPSYNKAKCETILEGKNNTYIVFGRDRPASRSSGYGGRGATQAGSIDIVVGRMSMVGPKTNIWVDPNFISDAARIYISQKTDIDSNFGLVKGNVGLSRTRSGIGIKADAVRVIAREGIKLVTGVDGQNSHGGERGSTLGIDLIAGNDDEPETHFSPDRGFYDVERLQPMIKGGNLTEAIKQLVHHVSAQNGLINNFVTSQMEFNAGVMAHVHQGPPISGFSPPSPTLIAPGVITAVRQLALVKSGLWLNKVNLLSYELSYLEPYSQLWICSRYNRTN